MHKLFQLNFWTILSITILMTFGFISDLFIGALYKYRDANQVKVSEQAPEGLHNLLIENEDGSQTHAWYQKAATPHAPVVIYFHGNSSNIQTVYNDGLFQNVRQMDAHLIAFDYPQYGRSTGRLNEKTTLEAAQSILNFAKAKFNNSPIILWGRSFGAGIVPQVAANNLERVKGLILMSPWTNTAELVKSKTYMPLRWCHKKVRGHQYNTLSVAQQLDVPTLIIHGTQDKKIPFHMAQKLHTTLPLTKLISLEGVGHSYDYNDNLLDAVYDLIHGAYSFKRTLTARGK